jgi:group I intron endonuclease
MTSVISGVYALVNVVTGKMYIGGRQSIVKAISRHYKDLSKGLHKNHELQKDYCVYGDCCFGHALLEQCDLNQIHDREQWWMDNVEDKYNLSSSAYGGHGLGIQTMKGRVMSEETKRKIGEKSRSRTHSQETRQKISKSKQGQTPWNKGRKQ